MHPKMKVIMKKPNYFKRRNNQKQQNLTFMSRFWIVIDNLLAPKVDGLL